MASEKRNSSVEVNLANINLSTLPNGIYFVQFTNGAGLVTHKYVKI
ncbi:MAG: T9SS type A sorting domain-containing protein [Saprospiraceae bacterium]|nr:T9SS type A sorting domain-containing protein [Candidatus Parvibacillus calidus]